MSANLDLVRSIYARWERGDWSQADWADAQIEFVIADGPDQHTIRGVEAMAGAWGKFLAAWRDYAIVGEEFRELGGGSVLVLLRAVGRGKTSGIGITDSDRGANIFTIRGGAVTRLAIYFDHRNALSELGSASDENLRVVRSAIEAYLRGDEATMLALTSPDVVATQFPDQLDVGDHRGREELQRMMAEWVGAWEDWTIEPVSFEATDERVFVNAVQRGRGRESGVPMESWVTFVFTVRDGRIARWQMFHTEQEAREATGHER